MELLNLKIIIYQFLTSSIFNLTDLDKSKQQDLLKLAEEEAKVQKLMINLNI